MHAYGLARRPSIGRLATVLASLAVGIAVGLGISWGLWPVEYANADLADLRPAHKDEYVRMIGATFELDGDLVAATRRLSLLNLGTPAQSVNDFLAREKRTNRDLGTQTAVFHLAQALYGAQATQHPNPAATSEPNVLFVAGTATPAVPAFELIERTPLSCAEQAGQAQLLFHVRDARGQGLPNIAIEVRWPFGDDTLHTGLKPERGLGFADFEAAPGTYSVKVLNASSGGASQLVVGDPPANCSADKGAAPRGWKLVFQQK